MFWFILGIIGFVVVLIFIVRDTALNVWERVFFSFVALISAFLLSILFLLLLSIIVSNCAKIDYDMVSDTKIVALKDNRDISGNYYVCSGYVNEDLYYYYATETEFGYKTEKVSASSSYIKYTKDETRIEKYESRFTNDIAYLFACPLVDNRYVIYCPEGTITPEFNIDLE